jgi:hypothetical protein
MIKKELYRSFLLLLTRIVRGFIIPNLFSPIVYDSIVQVFALSRFSLIFDFGYREFAITSKNSRFYLKKLVLISIISGLILAIFSISLMHALKISFFLIPFFFVFYNLRFVYTIILVKVKDWSSLLLTEFYSLGFLFAMFLFVYLFSGYNIQLFFLFEVLCGIFILIYFYRNVKLSNNSSVNPSKFNFNKYFNSIQEFCIGNIESVVLALPFILNRGLLSIYIAVTAIGLIFIDPFSNFVIEKKINRFFVYIVIFVVSVFVAFLQVILLHEDSTFKIISWSFWDIKFAAYSLFLLIAKLVYNFERKLFLIKSLNNPTNILIQNFVLITTLIITCFFIFYNYNV